MTKNETIPEYVTGKRLAEHLGISRRTVAYLTKVGIFENEETENGKPSKYRFDASARNYIEYLQEKAKKAGDRDLKLRKLKADVKYKQAKAAKEVKELKELEAEYLRAADVELFTADLIHFASDEIRQLPERTVSKINPNMDAQEITGILEKEADEVLRQISEHTMDQSEYETRIRECSQVDDDM